jgi:predicted DNA-binding transcriptional regulator AlpA
MTGAAMARQHRPGSGLLDISDLMELFSCDRSTVWRMRKKGTIPEPLEVPGLGKRWPEEEIFGILAQIRVERWKARVSPPPDKPPAKGEK